MVSPTIDHWIAVEQILCYLKGAPGCGILYSNHEQNIIKCFSDSDWAPRRTEGPLRVTVFVGRNLVS